MKRAVIGTALAIIAVIGGAAIIGIVGTLERAMTERATTPHPVPATSTVTLTIYEQPGVIPPPIEEAEKVPTWKTASGLKSTTSTTRTMISNAAVRRSGVRANAESTNGTSPVADVRLASTRTVEGAPLSQLGANDPYHDSMMPGGSKWATPISTVPADARTVSVRTPSATTETSVTTASAEASTSSLTTPISTTTAVGCLTITTDFQQDCTTANRWLDDIGTKYGALMQRHYRWLTAATVGDWRVNGCDPSPCDANGTRRVQPTDYFGAQGYDSPLGTCHSTTPFRRAGAGRCSRKDESLGCNAPGAMSTLGILGGTPSDDGRVRGWVRWHSGWYVGTVEDATCSDACSVGFDHPCDLSEETEEPAQRFDVAGTRFWSWWWGGDPNGEPPWE